LGRNGSKDMKESGIKRRWVLPTFIVVGVATLFFAGNKLGSPSSANAELQIGNEGEISVVPIQIERDKYGLAMIDRANQTLWIYEINSIGPAQPIEITGGPKLAIRQTAETVQYS